MATKFLKSFKNSSFFLNGPSFSPPPPFNGLAISGGTFYLAASLIDYENLILWLKRRFWLLEPISRIVCLVVRKSNDASFKNIVPAKNWRRRRRKGWKNKPKDNSLCFFMDLVFFVWEGISHFSLTNQDPNKKIKNNKKIWVIAN